MSFGNDPQVDPELQREILIETQKSKMVENVHRMTDLCWDKCVDKVSTKKDSKMEKCVTNCVDRFLETNVYLVNKLGQMGNR